MEHELSFLVYLDMENEIKYAPFLEFSAAVVLNNINKICFTAREQFPNYFLNKELRISVPKHVAEAVIEYQRGIYKIGYAHVKEGSTEIFGFPIHFSLTDEIIIGSENFMWQGETPPRVIMTNYSSPEPKIVIL